MFKLSPTQFHAMSERERVRAGLSGFAGFADGVDVTTPEGAVLGTQRRPTELLDGTFGPRVGSGLGQRRPRLALSRDEVDFKDHSLLNLPQYTRLPGSNIRPGAPGVLSGFRGAFAGLGRLGFELTQVAQPKTSTSVTNASIPGSTEQAYASEKAAADAAAKLAAQNRTNLHMHLNAITEYHAVVSKSAGARLADMNALQGGGTITVEDIAQVSKNVAVGLDIAEKMRGKARESLEAMEKYGESDELNKARDLAAGLDAFATTFSNWQSQLSTMKATVPAAGPNFPLTTSDAYAKPSNNTGLIVAGIAAVALAVGVVIYRS